MTDGLMASELAPTPTFSGIPHVLGGFETIAQALDYAAQGATGLNFYTTRGALGVSLTYAELRSRALLTAAKLVGTGLRPGDRVALVAETGPDFPITFFACQYAGLVPCPVPFTSYVGGRDAYVQRISRMIEACEARALIGPGSVATVFDDEVLPGGARLLTFAALADMPEGPFEPPAAGEVAYVQFSSGSTAQPKGVVITQSAVSANVTGTLRHGMRLVDDDRTFSWLPFYHDMGLVGFLLGPTFGQRSADYLTATGFVRRPSLWLSLMSQNRTTISYAPTFGYKLAAERFRADEHGELDLSALRVAGVGGDMIRPDVLEGFSERLQPTGFHPRAFLPSYGMAEATLALTFANDGQGLTRQNPTAPASAGRGFVSCGRPLPGHEILIVDDDGTSLPELTVGNIWARGPSLMRGYLGQPELTTRVMQRDGFMATGDLGYLNDGSLIVTGRAKDLILINGRNIWPEDLEWTAETAAGLGHGQVVAFSIDNETAGETVVVLLQVGGLAETDNEMLRTRVASTLSQASGVACTVVLVPPHTIPMTSSGKLQRRTARDTYLAGKIAKL